MDLEKVLITGSCGLVGSEATLFFLQQGATVIGIDNDSRGKWFGKEGSVQRGIGKKLLKTRNYKHISIDIINKAGLEIIISEERPNLIIHCAAQPSHDKSAGIPWEDFMVNAVGTVNLLDLARRYVKESPFVFISTNKVYGDRPNTRPIREEELRYESEPVDESMSIDQCLHSPFGASKASADLMVQEYGKYFHMPTVCFRCGCITGSNQQGVELHGFLSHLCRTATSGKSYAIYGYKGKQVRDILHASDLVQAIHEFAQSPRYGEVYNLGGGYQNSVSILEALETIRSKTGIKVPITFGEARKGDHICYYTDNGKFRSHYEDWEIRRDLDSVFDELLEAK